MAINQMLPTEGSRPVPDPTVLTTDQLRREISALRELIETRLDGMDKAIELLQAATDRYPASIKAAVATLQELHAEKFQSIAIQFMERDTRTEQTSRDGKVAIDAALQAQKEAVGKQNESNALAIAKSEAGFTKQIDQISVLIQATAENTNGKIEDIKSRVGAIEGHSKGATDVWGYVVGVIGLLVAVVSVVVVFLTK
jgi:hypothetical protein